MNDKMLGKTAQKKGLRGTGSSLFRTISTVGLALAMLLLLASCDGYRVAEKCSDYIPRGDKGKFVTDTTGIAKDIETGTTWYRCAAGMRFSNFRCKGDTLNLSWDDATEYAKEFSEKSGVEWRLPTNDEMKSIIEPSCISPAVNENVFPSTATNNHWTSTDSWHQNIFKCSVNTFSGSLTCRQARMLEQPFLLVQD
ncbi:DUF1566 domain-containing protein [Porticoccaceae bacterium]|nr:DUF1566 domain-containing protein [Porticoccaceae bacterium]MDB4308479.1 DUF1566 domain-containing protein [Porticoccaceae bacterium]MDB9999540.1 DUF1566 domain-containing protein [Porticoccaceae bacterium]MDC0003733.1 DUF1566 domain-containing protein [Porticoccaceae bacterium]